MIYRFLSSFFITAFCGAILKGLMPLIVDELECSALYTASTYAIGYLPYLIIMPIGGVLADVFNKKRMMQVLALANLLLIGAMIAVVYIFPHIYLVLLLQFMLSAVAALQHPVFQGMVPAIVSREKAKSFHAYTSMITYASAVVAPALVGGDFDILK